MEPGHWSIRDMVQVESPWMGTWSGENYTKNELLWLAAEIGVCVPYVRFAVFLYLVDGFSLCA